MKDNPVTAEFFMERIGSLIDETDIDGQTDSSVIADELMGTYWAIRDEVKTYRKRATLVWVNIWKQHFSKSVVEAALAERIKKMDAIIEKVDFSSGVKNSDRHQWDKLAYEVKELEEALGL